MIDPERFWKHCMLQDDSEDSCWIWTGALRDGGQGRYRAGGKGGGPEMLAHHAAYELIHGYPPPEGFRLEHYCNRPQCVRHWRIGRRYRVLTPRDVERIRTSLRSLRALAAQYGVTKARIGQIRSCTY